jgi:DWNN domain
MSVYFKFKSAKEFHSLPIEGQFITIGNLKERVFELKHLGRGNDFDLVISNAQTNEGRFTEESALSVYLLNFKLIVFIMSASRVCSFPLSVPLEILCCIALSCIDIDKLRSRHCTSMKLKLESLLLGFSKENWRFFTWRNFSILHIRK